MEQKSMSQQEEQVHQTVEKVQREVTRSQEPISIKLRVIRAASPSHPAKAGQY
jgi:hypothetical protein